MTKEEVLQRIYEIPAYPIAICIITFIATVLAVYALNLEDDGDDENDKRCNDYE